MSAGNLNTQQSHAADELVSSTSPSPPRRDPVEDADPSFTRKRPRIDDGGPTLRAMSNGSESPNRTIMSPHKEMVAMTIREQASSSPSPAEDDEHDHIATGHSTARVSTPTTSPPIMDITEADPTSPPVIEILDDDDNELATNFLVQLNAEDHFRQFPRSERFRSHMEALREMVKLVQSDLDIPHDLLPALAHWLQDLPDDPSAQLQEFYTTRVLFWNDFASLVSKVLGRRYRWMTALNAGQDDDMTRYPFGEQFGDDLAVDEVFSNFLSAYMRLCSHLFLVDVHMLSCQRPDEHYSSPLLSEKHLRHLLTILRTEKEPVFHLLRKEHAINLHEMSDRLHTDFLTVNGAQNLLRLADEAFHKVPPIVQTHIATYTSQVLGTLGWTICRFPHASSGIDPAEYYRGTLLFFRKYTEDLQEPAKVTDANVARDMIMFFSDLIQEICQWDEQLAKDLADELLDFDDPESPTSSSVDTDTIANQNDYRQYPDILPVLIANAWKFRLLRKYIVKGRMELRVMSIFLMDKALVELHREYSAIEPLNKHPVLRYLADVLLRGRVVDYIISVDSHPQLISRSGNIVGFLVVTDRWLDRQADAVWNTVSNSPDPRVVAATMTMLRNIIGLMGPSDHLYLCLKIHSLSVESFTLDILRFLRELTTKLLNRHPPVDWSLRNDTARPWNVCVRLLQDTAPRNGVSKHELDLHAEADDQLRSLANEIPERDQHNIYRQCLEHIAQGSDAATGSVRIVYILSSFGDVTFLEQNVDMARQILEELSSFVKTESKRGLHRYQLSALQYRLELLAFLVSRVGHIVPEDLYRELWDHVVGMYALSDRARDVAWAQLSEAIRSSPDNDFCRKLVSNYVSVMDPQHYTSGLYDFVASYNFPITRKFVLVDDEEHTLLQIPGSNLLWSLALLSPQGTIEERASRLLATRYSQIIQNGEVTVSEVEAAHVELVEQCMKELRSAFNVLREGPEQSKQSSRDRFGRVLMFQRQMLESVRQKPEFNRGRRADSKVESMDTEVPAADAVTIKYQCANDRQSLLIAPDNTVEDLYRRLCHATGCTRINIFANGQKVKIGQSADQKISDANFAGQLLVQRVEDVETARSVSAPVAGSSEFETHLVKHFDEMFDWLDTDEVTSQMLFDFLIIFPYRNAITDSVVTGKATSDDLFPPGKFFKSKYAAQAMHSKLKDQIRSSSLDEIFLVNAVKLLDRAILSEELLGSQISVSHGLPLAAVLVSAMLEFLRERPSSELSASYFSNTSALADRLMEILLVTLQTTDSATITQECYATILEVSLYSFEFWQAFWKHPQVLDIHRTLLLNNEQPTLRDAIKLKILSVCGGHLPSSCSLSTADIASQFWTIIDNILPETLHKAEQSAQLFDLAEHVFRTQDLHDRREESSRSLLHNWSSLLLAYNHTETPGRYKHDNVVLGFTKLMLCCVSSLKSFKLPLDASALISSIFQKFIFTLHKSPAEDVTQQGNSTPAPLPILGSDTRRELYDLMLALVDDNDSCERLLRLTSEVEKEDVDNILPTISVDRSLEIRSRTGYVGLHNPRAICYMNSLLTQLFMNLNFRQFILGLEVQEADGSQRLLFETQKLFATMQNSYRKAADPRPFAACVKTLDKTPIDIGVQMDADEFYNLLFDQWEAQLVSNDDKQRFRNFYGGQMLQQVKSKECEHVSERADSFFALQCDVQGKVNLQESLQAFVQGDVMEGDNKYKCETCGGKFVDAVKRTCLKTAPNNLIFHLKRFDFDLTDFSRKKVHEHFAFPETIDIGLYTVEHLSDPSKPHEEDFFDLVGVVVHFGNCENGHYYSYIRKRPYPTSDASPTWLNFNDQEVDPFDPAEIPQKAFGGAVEDSYSRQFKLYSAYMLFYQRRTAIVEDQQQWTVSSKAQPSKVAVPRLIQDAIDDENARFIREYCLFDPHHSAFVRQLHTLSRKINNGSCSEDHKLEGFALEIFLAHLTRVVWRQQTTVTFDEALTHLRRSVLACEMCCSITLQWLARDDDGLYNLLMRSSQPSVRSQTRSLVVDSLKFLRGKDPVLYHMDSSDSDTDVEATAFDAGALSAVIKRLKTLALESYRAPRAWDDLYLMLTQIADLGYVETAVLLNMGFLDFCLRLFCIHALTTVAQDYTDFKRILEKRRNVYNRLIGFVSTVLSRTNMSLPVCEGSDRMTEFDHKQMRFPLTEDEKSLVLYWHGGDLKAFAAVDKMVELFDQTKTESFYPGEIVRWMLGSPDEQIQRKILTMIVQGITEFSTPFCDAYLRVALCYCEASTYVDGISKVCDTVVDAIAAVEGPSDENRAPRGGNVLRFLKDVAKVDNPVFSTADFYWYLVTRSDRFAVPLLVYSEEIVRNAAHDFIYNLYSTYLENANTREEAYKGIRSTASEVIKRIAYESSSGTPRSHMAPIVDTGKTFIQVLYDLELSEDPDYVMHKDDNDKVLFYQWQIEVESRMRMLPEDSTPRSTGEEVFDQSDYGSESDDVELLDQ